MEFECNRRWRTFVWDKNQKERRPLIYFIYFNYFTFQRELRSEKNEIFHFFHPIYFTLKISRPTLLRTLMSRSSYIERTCPLSQLHLPTKTAVAKHQTFHKRRSAFFIVTAPSRLKSINDNIIFALNFIVAEIKLNFCNNFILVFHNFYSATSFGGRGLYKNDERRL